MTAMGYKDRACSLDVTRFYIAEVIVALEYLHTNVSVCFLLLSDHLCLCPRRLSSCFSFL